MPRHRFDRAFALCTLFLALAACGGKQEEDPRTQPPLVRAETVRTAGGHTRSFTGTIQARVQSDLAFRVGGKLQDRLVDAGEVVRRGQPLMRMDPVDLELAAGAQRQVVAAAEARAHQTRQDEARYKALVASGVVSVSAYDQVKATADTAAADLRAARAQAGVAANASGYTTLLADADGVVMETLGEPGQVVAAGQVVVRVARSGPREAVVQLPETLRPLLGAHATASVFGQAGAPIGARLRVLSGAADPVTRTFEARYTLDDAAGSAPLGATVTVALAADAGPDDGQALRVPIASIIDRGDGPGVWIIQGEPETASWRPVRIVRLADDAAYIAGGLKDGERIAALGAHLLRDGMPVRTGDVPVVPKAAGVAR
ncbi:efflux RND transporter periplasmic adaptor subunit [Xanthomonas sp. XNM01]|uniref:efflux RND transporter periplasmic adaptor subunit n=1 Tax=Xanthomonas sp. XNM01 TaxID=2769289 RepID=UPI00177F64CE|nr:efflux RND transporter periplasmic adaptor subunit [Xanthomonas sp. XNM01]MBD9370137.1 efflux RND transporter periplasmic adaptor subunit [Xanthomonas sp. XNM01]